jgi:hypothetical protein
MRLTSATEPEVPYCSAPPADHNNILPDTKIFIGSGETDAFVREGRRYPVGQ